MVQSAFTMAMELPVKVLQSAKKQLSQEPRLQPIRLQARKLHAEPTIVQRPLYALSQRRILEVPYFVESDTIQKAVKRLVKRLQFSFQKRETPGNGGKSEFLLGSKGCGKSTLLEQLGTVLPH
eukprot:TRINITY_DN6953_c0_g1_i1.p1 TRINITY_DN6953_c0_g1~~TRINITY_DN6953_c0_g1_i1.p1  ORF type:complete len:123 (+),score=15.72 TRINITY_DN6953_c0_g1_i1:184-552(+)